MPGEGVPLGVDAVVQAEKHYDRCQNLAPLPRLDPVGSELPDSACGLLAVVSLLHTKEGLAVCTHRHSLFAAEAVSVAIQEASLLALVLAEV